MSGRGVFAPDPYPIVAARVLQGTQGYALSAIGDLGEGPELVRLKK
jgi:hypothetical protein